MNLTPIAAYFTPSLLRRSAVLALALTVMGACSEDEEAPAPQPDFGVEVSSLDGIAPDQPVELQCDLKLAVGVTLSTSIENIPFLLRPAGACGSTSKRCGYLRIEALSASDEQLARADTTTTAAILPLAPEHLTEIAELRATLMSGVDKTPMLNKDGTEVSSAVSPPSFSVRSDCPEPAGSAGEGGAGGLGGAAGAGAGAGPEGGAGTGGLAGQGGVAGAGGTVDGGAAGSGGQSGVGAAGAADPGS